MAFDWIEFLDQYHISYVTSGPSVTRGNIAVRCPWCASEDPSTHMGISLEGKGWHCWRQSDHRGRNPTRLVQALLHCSADQASQIVGYSSSLIGDDFLEQVKQRMPDEDGKSPAQESKLALPAVFKPLKQLPSARPYLGYLSSRGFDPLALTDYGIRYCTSGPYHGRIVFPVYREGRLIAWTGRSIYPDEEKRYKTLSPNADKAAAEGYDPAVTPINHQVLFHDLLLKLSADTLCICEGPFDALKVMMLGRSRGVVATCLFTNQPTIEQVDLLYDLAPRFSRRFLLLDRDMFYTAIKTSSSLTGLELVPLLLPDGIKDPGELDRKSFSKLMSRDT